MKKLVLLMLCSFISGYETTPSPTLITLKLESSEIVTDSEGGLPRDELNNSIPVLPKAYLKQNYVEESKYRLRQLSDTQFEVLGSPLSRAIEENND
tara:strand:- start:126 stop:413 length:288 start_codon:yes stop_codon:yes gene_type:complete